MTASTTITQSRMMLMIIIIFSFISVITVDILGVVGCLFNFASKLLPTHCNILSQIGRLEQIAAVVE